MTATVLGAIGSLAFMFLVGRRNQSSLIMVLFAGWVTLPFLGLGLADYVSKGWTAATRTTLHVLMILLPLGSLALYEGVLVSNARTPAFRFLVVPLVSWALMLTALPFAAWWSRPSQGNRTPPGPS